MSRVPEGSWLREIERRLVSPPPRRLPPGEARRAAVLVALYVDAGQLWTLLTRRSDALPNHRGQIAFPGGACEPGEDPWPAALRESREEVGLEPGRVLRLGELDEVVTTASGFRIVPCVGAVPQPLALRPNPAEIAEAFTVPLSALANPGLVEDRPVMINGVSQVLRIYHVGRHPIWGVTARILSNLLARLGADLDAAAAP